MSSLLAGALIVLPAFALADPAGVRVEHAFSRALPAGRVGMMKIRVVASLLVATCRSIA